MTNLPIFIIGTQPECSKQTLKKIESLNAMIINTDKVDEIDQAGKQAQKAILIFFDFKFACQFISRGMEVWSGFRMLKILLLPAQPVITPEVDKKICLVGLNIFNVENEGFFIEKLEQFKKEEINNPEDIESIELEFLANMESKK